MKFIVICALCFWSAILAAEPYQNQISLDWGTSFRSDGFEQDLDSYTLSYSQPNTFFRQTGRRSLHLSRYDGVNSDGVDESINLFGLSQDVLFGVRNGYAVIGLGAFISSEGTDRIGSKFVFRERIGVGAYYGPFNIEVFALHYSNGTLQEPNRGENFAAVSLGYQY